MKLLRVGILCLFVSAAFAQRGGSHGGGGFSRGGGGGFSRGGGGGFSRGGGGGFSRGGGGGFSHGGGGGFSRGFSGGGFRGGSGFSRGGFNRGFGGFRGGNRYAFGFGFGLGYPYWGYGYGWGYPYYYDYYPYGYGYSPYAYTTYPSYYDSGYGSAPVVVNQTYSQPNPAPPVQIREYGQNQQPGGETLYLIAFRDHRIQAAVAYWVEGDTLHYVTREHEQAQVPLDDVDRAFSEQLNRDRRVEFRLPR